MTTLAGPLYEASFFIEPEAVTAFDLWLEEQVRISLREQGISDVRAWSAADDDQGRPVRICQFRCSDENALDDMLDGHFAEIDATIADTFDDAVTVLGRSLREDSTQDIAHVESPNCLNCGTRLRGQYCGNCGQRASSRLISLWQLLSEAFGDLLEFDSRLWRTIIPLLARPGSLTRDYLQGRRARYMPPFRMYLVLSVVFFVIAFFDPSEDLSLLYEPEPEPTPEEAAEQATAAQEARDEVLAELAKEGIIVGDESAGNGLGDSEQAEEDDGLNITINGESGGCEAINIDGLADMPDWFQRRLTPERIKHVCESLESEGGRKFFVGLLLDNIPVALIVLMPLMALVLKILYPLSRRYFVEHLLFFVHFHAFFFLVLTLQILFARLAALVRVPEALVTLAIVVASFYIPVYLYMAMRRVYGQGHVMTFIKYVGLLISYSAGATLTMLAAVLFALVSV